MCFNLDAMLINAQQAEIILFVFCLFSVFVFLSFCKSVWTWTQCWSCSAGGSPLTIIWLSFTQFIWDRISDQIIYGCQIKSNHMAAVHTVHLGSKYYWSNQSLAFSPAFSQILKRDPLTVWFYPYLVHRVLAQAVIEHLVVGVQHHHHLQRSISVKLSLDRPQSLFQFVPKESDSQAGLSSQNYLTGSAVWVQVGEVHQITESRLFLTKKKLRLIFCGIPPEEDGDIFYVDGLDPFLGLNIFGNLLKIYK